MGYNLGTWLYADPVTTLWLATSRGPWGCCRGYGGNCNRSRSSAFGRWTKTTTKASPHQLPFACLSSHWTLEVARVRTWTFHPYLVSWAIYFFAAKNGGTASLMSLIKSLNFRPFFTFNSAQLTSRHSGSRITASFPLLKHTFKKIDY